MNARRQARFGLMTLGAIALLAAVRYGQGATPLDARVQVRTGSRMRADGSLQPGRRLDAAAAARLSALQSLSSALALVPAPLAPSSLLVDVELQGSVGPVAFHALAGSLLVGRGAEQLPGGVWLHELGHARMQGSRAHGALAQRLLRAVDEGAADYFAACLSANPRVGDHRELRDLREPPRIESSEWATLALPDFDPHRLGWALAGRLYQAEPRPGPLLAHLVECLDGPSELEHAVDRPTAVIQALLSACPAAGRERLSSVLAAWLPAELSNPESPL